MNLINFPLDLTETLLVEDQKSYDRQFFDLLETIKAELDKVEKHLEPYHQLSNEEYLQAENHYFHQIDELNALDMNLRKNQLGK